MSFQEETETRKHNEEVKTIDVYNFMKQLSQILRKFVIL